MNGMRHIPLINGVEYSWADLTVLIAGVPVIGITAINYDDTQDKENIRGAGQTPIARGYGNIEATASITLLRSEVESIREGAPNGRLGDIAPFDIIVQFVPLNGGKIVTHIIKNAEFTSDANRIAQGETKNETEFPLIVSHIDFGGGI